MDHTNGQSGRPPRFAWRDLASLEAVAILLLVLVSGAMVFLALITVAPALPVVAVLGGVAASALSSWLIVRAVR